MAHSSSPSQALFRCPQCREEVHMEDVIRTVDSGPQTAIVYHHDIGEEGSPWHCERIQLLPTRLWNIMFSSHHRRESMVEDEPELPESEMIGRLVQGFRIDLDVVDNLGDITLLWDDQARHRPHSIPKEVVPGGGR